MPKAHQGRSQKHSRDSMHDAPTAPLSTYAGRKRPWLLALAAALVAGWIGFLAYLAWRG
jgi:hypothetical protein